jgi:hypothetical protein
MRTVLRLLALLAGFSVVITILFILRFGWTGIKALLATGSFGALTIVGWLVTLIAGPMAAIHLFRLRQTGRIAAAVLFGSMLIYYLIGLIAFRQPEAPVSPIVTLCVALMALVIIPLSPAAKRACTSQQCLVERNVGECEQCRRRFEYRIIHNGFNDTAYAYCDSCGMTTFVGGYGDTRQPVGAPLKIHGPIQAETEEWLQPCTCGGCFRHDAAPRCPHCREPLSAEAATSFIERNAEGTRGGWRWQRSWSGMYCLVIDGRSTKNNWREPAAR